MKDVIEKLIALQSEIEVQCNKMTYSQASRVSRAIDRIESAIDVLQD